MPTYIETKVTYSKEQENGALKRVTETFLVNADTFTEAEAITIHEVARYFNDYNVAAVKKSNIKEIFACEDTDKKWWKVKVNFITLNEKTTPEKRMAHHILVSGDTFAEALDHFNACMRGTLADFEIASITETPIIDLLNFDKE